MHKGLAIAALLLFGAAGISQGIPTAGSPVQSEHRRRLNGWEGWTLNYSLPNLGQPGERFPMMLVLAHHGRIVRQISDESFIWRWMFVDGGRKVAYETGPLHFSMDCVLVDTKTGKRLGEFDCYHELAPDAPDWLEQLEASK